MGENGKKDLYALLGLGSTASPALIREAFRALVREQPRTRLPELISAYEVLSDPARRDAYDAARRLQARRNPQRMVSSPPPRLESRAREDVALPVPAPVRERPASAMRARSIEAISSGPPGSDPGSWPPVATLLPAGRAESPDPARTTFELEARISAEEARNGTMLTLSLPRDERCPRCGARGVRGCATCRGTGLAIDPRPVEVRLPGGLAEGARVTVPLDRLGLPGASLGVRVRVRGR